MGAPELSFLFVFFIFLVSGGVVVDLSNMSIENLNFAETPRGDAFSCLSIWRRRQRTAAT